MKGKRILSLLLTTALFLTSAVPAFADEIISDEELVLTEEIGIVESGYESDDEEIVLSDENDLTLAEEPENQEVTPSEPVEEEPTAPSAELAEKVDQARGVFTIAVKKLQSQNEIDKVVVYVWTKDDKSDQIRYIAEKMESGNYRVKDSISKYEYAFGTYHVQAKIVDSEKKAYTVANSEFQVTVNTGSTLVSELSVEKTYRATVKDLLVPAGAKRVFFKVWNNKEGKSIVKRYDAELTAKGNYTSKINVKDFAKVKSSNAFSTYTVCAYAEAKSGEYILLSKNTKAFSIQTEPAATVKMGSFNYDSGKVKLRAAVNNSPSGVSKVRARVWYKDDKSDIKWYDAQKQDDGTYVTYIPIAEHDYYSGTYHVQTYVKMGNGIECKVFEGTKDITFTGFLYAQKTQQYGRMLRFVNASDTVKSVKVAIWSETGGQDDLKWTNMTKSGNTWTCAFKLSDYKHNGVFNVHVYSGKTCLRKGTFTVSENYSAVQWKAIDVLNKNGWNLRAAFNYSAGLRYQRVAEPPAGQSHVDYYANIGFTGGFGHCYIMASTFVVMARLLGYEAYLMEGDVAASHGGRNVHGWVELVENGQVNVYDPNFTNETGRDGFKINYGQSGTWQYGNYKRVD